MHRRYLSLWFRHLTTDRLAIRRPELRDRAFVTAAPERGRMVVKAVSAAAAPLGLFPGMALADARAVFPSLQVFSDKPYWHQKLLRGLAEWSLRYTPVACIDPPDGLVLDISGCPHLWGGERPYLKDIVGTLRAKGYRVRGAIADTVGAAWAVARYGEVSPIIGPGSQREALLPLPPVALRLDADVLQRLTKLGFRQIGQFLDMPAGALRRRFGDKLLLRIGQALGTEPEALQPVQPLEPYLERLPCMEPISTATGIAIALKHLLDKICARLSKEGKGLRTGIFRGYRLDGKVEQVAIGTSRASHNPGHLFRLFELKIPSIEPDLGIELFEIEAPLVEKIVEGQEVLWQVSGRDHVVVGELLDRIAGKIGMQSIRCYLPQEHHWPERSIKEVPFLAGQAAGVGDVSWPTQAPRPVQLLSPPEPIEVMVPLPDYPPLHFRHRGTIFRIVKADGPERIEQEWWLQTGPPRDYYCVEDESGARYWLFRLGLYGQGNPQWFLHGFFA